MWEDPLDVELRARSMTFFDELGDEVGVKWTGIIRVTRDETDLPKFEASAAAQRDCGIKDVAILDRDDLSKVIPAINVGDIAGAIFSKRGGHLDGHLLCRAYLARASALGVRVMNRTRLVGMEAGKLHKHRLITTGGEVECDVVVNAAGPWAGDVGATLGAPVTILPQRHEVFVIHLLDHVNYTIPEFGEYFPGTNGLAHGGLYIQHHTPTALLAGLHGGLADQSEPSHPDEYARTVSETSVEPLAAEIAHRFPAFERAGVDKGWTGLYPLSADEKPLLGPCDADGTILCAGGCGGFGLQVSPMIGQLAAEWAIYGEPRTLPSASRFGPGRFSGRAA
jgi:sarcosine oxidase subunit beta